MDQDAARDETADPAAAAFEALRGEVALLNVAVAGLAAERTAAPDYSEILGEIAKGVSTAVGRLGKVMASPALSVSPALLARQIAAAGDEVRRHDRVMLHQAQDGLEHAANDLRGWIDGARLANVQNWRLVQVAAGAMIAGVWLPGTVARAAPDRWAWPEKMAARVLQKDGWAAGARMLSVADGPRWKTLNGCQADQMQDAQQPLSHRPKRTKPSVR